MTALAGLAAGRWIAGTDMFWARLEDASLTADQGGGSSSPKRLEARPATEGGLPTVEESVSEARVAQLWASKDFLGTQDALLAYARVNPARAIELAMSLEGADAWKLAMEFVVKLPPNTGGIAMDTLLRHPRYLEPCPLQHAVFWLCAQSDPERAWREAHAPGVKFLDNALNAIASGCAETDPRLAMTFAGRLTKAGQKNDFASTVLRQWSKDNPRDLIAWLGTQGDIESLAARVPWGQMHFDTKEDFLAMAKLVPPGVLDGTISGSSSFGSAGEGGWATRMDWLKDLPEGAARQALYAGAARALIGADPEKALALLPELMNASLKRQVLSATAAYRAALSPQEGFAFADAITDEAMRRLARQSVLLTWAENDPAAAAKHAWSSKDAELASSSSRIGFKWAEVDPEAAASYALEQAGPNPGEQGENAISSLMSHWVGRDPSAASRWVKDLPPGAQQDQAASALARAAMRDQPDAAIQWAANIRGEAARQQAITNCFRIWMSTDRSRAAMWMQQAGLDDPMRQLLGQMLEEPPVVQPTGPRWVAGNGQVIIY